MPNIYDIAKAANVSKSTVSRVINDKPGVSNSKREKVLTVIKELNYKPNSAARKLGFEGTGTIEYVMTVNGPEPVQKLSSSIDYDHYIDKQIKPIAD